MAGALSAINFHVKPPHPRCANQNQTDENLNGVVMSDIKFDRRAGHLYRLTGDDVKSHKRNKSDKEETLFYSSVFIIGMLALGVVWN